MANNREEAGKGTPRPGEMPASRRPYATIDAEGHRGRGAASAAAGMAPGPSRLRHSRHVRKSAKPSEPNADRRRQVSPSAGARLASALALLGSRRRAIRLSTNLAAGAVGALLVLRPRPAPAARRACARARPRGRRPDAATGRRRERARHAPQYRPARPGRRDGPVARRAGRCAGQARRATPRRWRADRRRPGGTARAGGAPRQARGDAGRHVVSRSRRPVAAAGGARGQARRAAEARSARPARRHGRASPASTASCPPSAPRPAASPSASTASGARSTSG